MKKQAKGQMSHDEIYENFLDLLFKDASLDEKDTEQLNTLAKLFVKRKGWHVPYELITQKVYSYEDAESLKNSISEKLDNLGPTINDDIGKLKNDTKRHVILSIVQKEYIDRNVDFANEELREISGLKSTIYTDFITILGIFTAITFAIFGGLQLIGNVFGRVNNFSERSIGGAITLGATYLFAIYVILVILMVGIAKLQNRQYKVSTKVTRYVIASIIGMFILGILMIKSII